jgi:hypothetical protein
MTDVIVESQQNTGVPLGTIGNSLVPERLCHRFSGVIPTDEGGTMKGRHRRRRPARSRKSWPLSWLKSASRGRGDDPDAVVVAR